MAKYDWTDSLYHINTWLWHSLRLGEKTSLTLPLRITQAEKFMIVKNQKVNVAKWLKSVSVFVI